MELFLTCQLPQTFLIPLKSLNLLPTSSRRINDASWSRIGGLEEEEENKGEEEKEEEE